MRGRASCSQLERDQRGLDSALAGPGLPLVFLSLRSRSGPARRRRHEDPRWDLSPAYHTEEENYRCGGCHRDNVGPGGGCQERYPRCGHEANEKPYHLVDVHGLTQFPIDSENLEPGALAGASPRQLDIAARVP